MITEISEVRWMEHDNGYMMQLCTIDDKVYQRDQNEYSSMIMNAMATNLDMKILEEQDESNRLPSLNDIPWKELHDEHKEIFKEYNLFGEDTRVIRRYWFREEDGDIVPVVVESENNKRIHVETKNEE